MNPVVRDGMKNLGAAQNPEDQGYSEGIFHYFATLVAMKRSDNVKGTPGITLQETGDSTGVIEGGTGDTYTLVLTSQPSSDVTVSIETDSQIQEDRGGSIVFTPFDWDVIQTITLSAVDDENSEGPHESTITHSVSSMDTNYNEISVDDIIVSITDNDSAGVALAESGGSTGVTEGGATDTYTIVLTSQPTSDVTITIDTDSQISDDHGGSLVFTPSDWNVIQTVTLSAVDDESSEGDHEATITHKVSSSDAGYQDLSISSILVSITDNDSAGVSFVESSGSSSVTEGGAGDSYTIVLTSQPTSDVSITVTPDAQTTVNGSSSSIVLLFTSSDWDQSQTVSIAAVDDDIAEGVHSATIQNSVFSSDINYVATSGNNITVSITDNDSAGVSIVESGGSTGLTEGGATDSYTIVLTSEPVDDVAVKVHTDSQSNGSPTEVTFTGGACPGAGTWCTPQMITLTAVDDTSREGSHSSTVTHTTESSGDGTYDGISTGSIVASVIDNDYTLTVNVNNVNYGIITDPAGGSAPVVSGVPRNINTVPVLADGVETFYIFQNWSVVSGSVNFGNAGSASTTATVTGGDAVIQANYAVRPGPVSVKLVFTDPSVVHTFLLPDIPLTLKMKAWGGGGGVTSSGASTYRGGGGGYAYSLVSSSSAMPVHVVVGAGGVRNGGKISGIPAAGGYASPTYYPRGGGGSVVALEDTANNKFVLKVCAGGGGGGTSVRNGAPGGGVAGGDADNGLGGNNGSGGLGGPPASNHGQDMLLEASTLDGLGGDGGDASREPAASGDYAGGGGGGYGGGGGGTYLLPGSPKAGGGGASYFEGAGGYTTGGVGADPANTGDTDYVLYGDLGVIDVGEGGNQSGAEYEGGNGLVVIYVVW